MKIFFLSLTHEASLFLFMVHVFITLVIGRFNRQRAADMLLHVATSAGRDSIRGPLGIVVTDISKALSEKIAP